MQKKMQAKSKLNAYFSKKEPKLERLQVVWFQLDDILEMARLCR